MKKCSRLCSEAGTCDWISREARGLQAAKSCKRIKHAWELNSHTSWSTIGQKSRLAIQLARGLKSRLSQVARSSRQPALFLEKLTLRILFLHQYKYPSFPQNMGGYSERKTLREVSSNTQPIRESYSFLERNLYSLFSFPLSLSYLLRGDFYPNTTHTHLEC